MRRRQFIRTAGGIAVGATGTAAAQESGGSSSNESSSTNTVETTDNLTFEPSELTIAPGSTVLWKIRVKFHTQ